jgi:hypothetical protein
MTSLDVGININGKLITRWGAAVVQREDGQTQSYHRNEGVLVPVSDRHPLGSSADQAVGSPTMVSPRVPDPKVLRKLHGHDRPAGSRLGMADRTVHQPALTIRPTTYFDDYSSGHLTAAPAPAASVTKTLGASASGPVALEGLTAEQLERVSRFGLLPDSGPSKLKARPDGVGEPLG